MPRLDLPDLPALPDGAGLQKLLNDWLADHPEYQQYLEKIYYVPAEGAMPEDTTHTLVGTSARTAEALILALVVKPPYAGLADAALAALNTPQEGRP